MADTPDTATPAPEAAAGATAPDTPLTPEEQLAAANAEIAELKAQLKDLQLRNLAEMENLRKRNAQEIANARDFAAKDFAFSLLAVKDTLEMVLKDQQSTTEQIKMGVDMTLKNLVGAFERAKVKEVKAEKAKFDPNVHQAMTQIESTEEAPGTVLQVFQKGYMIADRVLRPAMVAVATAPSTKDDGAAPAAQA
ncbi:MAG: nucleotide exchange factor GrpE [Burkholderiales bacterium]|nr:nucleotide exchange factor GrpE [Burkholderiales bacterium]